MRELQSLSDGQIVLDAKAAALGNFPALDPGATFSRFGLGSSNKSDEAEAGTPTPDRIRDVRSPALQAVAAHLRNNLALEREARFRPSGDTVDEAQSKHMEAVRAALLQPPRTPLQPEEMVALLLVACGGALNQLPPTDAETILRGGALSPLLKHLQEAAPNVLESIARDGVITTEIARELDIASRLFVALRKASPPTEQVASRGESDTQRLAAATTDN